MADLVEKLRLTAGPHVGPLPALLHEAADEIERLRNEASDLRAYGNLARQKAREILGQST